MVIGECANCDAPLDVYAPTVRLFCSDRCQKYAKDVRYFRRCFRDERWHDPEVRKALATRMAFLVVGGYDWRGRQLSADVRQSVLAANSGLCRKCNRNIATEVDHIDGPSAARANLQGLCGACHREKTTEGFVPMAEPEQLVRDHFLAMVEAEEPSRPCYADDWHNHWPGLLRQTNEWREAQVAVLDSGSFGDGSTGTVDDFEHGLYMQMLADRDD